MTSGLRSRLPRKRKVLLIFVWIIIVIISSYFLFLLLPSQVEFFGYAVAGGISLLEFSLTDRVLDLVLGKEIPILSFEPLQLTPETKFNPIQSITKVWSSGTVSAEDGKIVENTVRQHELHARFGIICVKNMGSDAERCRVALQYPSFIHGSNRVVWLDGGHLNWYSVSRRQNLGNDQELDLTRLGLTLENTTEVIYKGEPKYLQVGFFNRQGPAFFFCSDMVSFPYLNVANLENLLSRGVTPEKNEFQLELTITALNYPVTKKSYAVVVTKDSILISESKNPPKIPTNES